MILERSYPQLGAVLEKAIAKLWQKWKAVAFYVAIMERKIEVIHKKKASPAFEFDVFVEIL